MEPPLEEISAALRALGCPTEKCAEMAAQLDRRARQLAESKGRPYESALSHLLRAMAGGWAARAGAGLPTEPTP